MNPRRRLALPRAFGAKGSVMQDNLYALSDGRHIFTSPWTHLGPLRHCSASITLTLKGDPFELTIDGVSHRHAAAAVKPMVNRALRTETDAMIAFQFDPSHKLYPDFRKISSAGFVPLNRQLFDECNDGLGAAYDGTLTIEQAKELFDSVVRIARPFLPKARPIDNRVAKTIELLWHNHNLSLTELAAAVGLSYYRLSHLFADNMGMTLRSYQQWRKVRKAISLSKHNFSLAQLAQAAGFSDAAHFSHVFAQLHAAPPSYFLQNENVNIVASATTEQECSTRADHLHGVASDAATCL